MSPIDMLFPDVDSSEGKIAKDLANIYFRTRLLDKGADWLFGTRLPFTTDDYAQATNDDESFITKAPTLAGKFITQKIDESIARGGSGMRESFGALPKGASSGSIGAHLYRSPMRAPNVVSGILGGVGRFFGR